MKVLLGFALLLTATVVKCQDKTESYIVLLNEDATKEHLEDVIQQMEKYSSLSRDEMSIESDDSMLPVLFGQFNEEIAEFVSSLENVDLVEKDQIVSDEGIIHSDEMSMDDLEASEDLIDTDRYNLDIVDDVTCTDGTFKPFNYGAGADIYVMSTGINYDHVEFGYRNGESGSRAKYPNFDIIDKLTNSNQKGRDCRGPGTFYAGVSAGLYSGIAKDAKVYSMRVINCNGKGYIGFIMRALNAVRTIHARKSLRGDFVGSIVSVTTSYPKSYALDTLIEVCVSEGIVVVTAAGDSKTISCYRSPGKSWASINVGNHGYIERTCSKPIGIRSNYGLCNSIMAPGVMVKSAFNDSDTELAMMSGTGVSASHVAGAAALIKSGKKQLPPKLIKERILTNGINDISRSSMSLIMRQHSQAKRLFITPKLIE